MVSSGANSEIFCRLRHIQHPAYAAKRPDPDGRDHAEPGDGLRDAGRAVRPAPLPAAARLAGCHTLPR